MTIMEQVPKLVFYAVYLPTEEFETSKENEVNDSKRLHVYNEKAEALQVMKQFKKARLKVFDKKEEAIGFATDGGLAYIIQPVTAAGAAEEKSNFKAPKPQELTQFRKVIERGDIDLVNKTVWKNPRYLVSSGDTPSILQEGCRYNALHIAVKVTQSPKMCQFILDTVKDPKFGELINGEETKVSYLDRGSILQDLYLNTPDKGLNETPLHFATKFGLKDVVKTLVSYPQCLKDSLNKYEQTPAIKA